MEDERERSPFRGLTDKARETLVVDASILKQVAAEGVVVLRKNEMYGTQIYDGLSFADRSRFDRLFFAAVGDSNNMAGVIVSTALIPAGIPVDQQIELARRVTQSLTGIVKHMEEVDHRERQLQSINEVMELRAVTDQKFSSPLQMIEAFVNRLREMADAERAVLFLVPPEGKGAYKPLCRCGIALAAGSSKKHAELEGTLAEQAVSLKDPEIYNATQLARLGVDSVVGAAILAPVLSPNGIAGARA